MIWTRTPATKWRKDVAMGVSPWKQKTYCVTSPEGTTGSLAEPNHVAPSGLHGRFDIQVHGFAPVATACRPFGTILTPGRYVGAEEVDDDSVVAIDRNDWPANRNDELWLRNK